MVRGDESPQGPRRSRGEQVRLAGAFALGALCVLFAVLNVDEVQVNWIVGKWNTPLIVVIVFFTLIGLALGLVVSRISRSRARRG